MRVQGIEGGVNGSGAYICSLELLSDGVGDVKIWEGEVGWRRERFGEETTVGIGWERSTIESERD
jgi:hypothetical protein